MPIAYYLHHRDAPDNYITHSSFAADREAIRFWLVRSLLKSSGIWGSGLDVLLTALRDQIKKHGGVAFPNRQLGTEMEKRGKSLKFEAPEIDDLLHLPYGDRATLPLLSLLFPFVDLRHEMHIDHVFPISRFTSKKLAKLGFDEDEAEAMAEHANALPNLQLLEGAANKEMLAALPADWLAKHKPSKASRTDYCDRHLLGTVPAELDEFDAWFTARRKRMAAQLKEILGA